MAECVNTLIPNSVEVQSGGTPVCRNPLPLSDSAPQSTASVVNPTSDVSSESGNFVNKLFLPQSPHLLNFCSLLQNDQTDTEQPSPDTETSCTQENPLPCNSYHLHDRSSNPLGRYSASEGNFPSPPPVVSEESLTTPTEFFSMREDESIYFSLDPVSYEIPLFKIYWSFIHSFWPIIFRPSFNILENFHQHPDLHYAMLSIACRRDVDIPGLPEFW